MKFQLIVWVCLIFYIRFCELQKHQEFTMKKMLLASTLALLIQDVLNRRLLFKTMAAVAPKETITIISSFLELGEENCRAAKICGGAENVVKTETQQTFVNGLLGFITLGIYTL